MLRSSDRNELDRIAASHSILVECKGEAFRKDRKCGSTSDVEESLIDNHRSQVKAITIHCRSAYPTDGGRTCALHSQFAGKVRWILFL